MTSATATDSSIARDPPHLATGAGIDILSRVEAMTYAGRQPLHEKSVKLLARLSSALLSSREARGAPQYTALGYWLRPAALERLCAGLAGRTAGEFLVPRGIALHLPPTNVDTLFVYSWAISVLAGNCNITRLPSQIDAQMQWLVSVVESAIEEAGEADRHIFINLPYSGPIVEALSRLCDLRMIWGGDAKVESASKLPLRPDGLSIGFPDRVSFAVISAAAYNASSDARRSELAANLSNDVFWFDQMGCGSPRVLFWIGDPDGADADLYHRTLAHAQVKGVATAPATAIAKFHRVNDLLAEGVGNRARRFSNALHVLESTNPLSASGRGTGGGFLVQVVIDDITDIAPAITRSVQTITHFGCGRGDLERLAAAISGRGGYRIVPVGQALQFGEVWDGLPLLEIMTRRIVVVP